MFSNALGLYPSSYVTDEVLYQYKTQYYVPVYFNVLMFGNPQERQRSGFRPESGLYSFVSAIFGRFHKTAKHHY